MLPKIIIVGAGFGGLEVAKGLKNVKAQITVFDANNHHLFQPLLYQVATAGLSPSDIASPIRHILWKDKNIDVRLERITGVDVHKKEVIAGLDRQPYDYLVIATGATHGYFGHPDWGKFAPGLKSISDATFIRKKILLAFEKAELETQPEARETLLTFVIVGGGPTGVELAGAIAELAQKALAKEFHHVDPRSAKIILIEAGDRVLSTFPEKLSARARQALEKLGVQVRLNARVTQVDQTGVWVGADHILSKTVLWAAGVVASPAGQWLGVEMDRAGRVKVNEDLTVPGHPDIYVIGDTASVVIDDKPLPGVSPVAMQEGRFVAKILGKRIQRGHNDPGLKSKFVYKNKGNLATVGRKFAVADLGFVQLSGFVAWFAWILVHIYYLIGFRNRLLVIIQWAWAYLTFQRGARLIQDSLPEDEA